MAHTPLARGGWDRCGSAQVRKGCLVLEPLGIVTSGDQQRGGRVGANAFQSNQLRRRFSHQTIQLLVEFADLFGELSVAARYRAQREFGGRLHVRGICARPKPRDLRHQLRCGEAPQSSLFSFSGALMSRLLSWLTL